MQGLGLVKYPNVFITAWGTNSIYCWHIENNSFQKPPGIYGSDQTLICQILDLGYSKSWQKNETVSRYHHQDEQVSFSSSAKKCQMHTKSFYPNNFQSQVSRNAYRVELNYLNHHRSILTTYKTFVSTGKSSFFNFTIVKNGGQWHQMNQCKQKDWKEFFK